jgi:Spy/CpxP family protein refolding chaperone
MDEMRKQMQEQMKANRDESEKRIAALLTPEQATNFQKMQEERQKRMEERRAEMQKRLDDDKGWF